MTVKDIINELNILAPEEAALSWDNVGLLVGSPDWEISKIYIALDATEDVINHAIKSGANLLITHHPMIFSSINRVTSEDLCGRRVMKLLENGIALYAMHTNFDIYKMGELADSKLGLKNTVPLEICTPDDRGIGSIGVLSEETTLGDCAAFVKNAFELSSVKVFGDPDTVIKKVAVLPGSGKSDIENAIAAGADVLITGDIDHHSGIDAVQDGLMIIDAGHYGVEHIFIKYMEKYLGEKCSEIETLCEPKKEPFYVI